jgi:hypothetical protein
MRRRRGIQQGAARCQQRRVQEIAPGDFSIEAKRFVRPANFTLLWAGCLISGQLSSSARMFAGSRAAL